MAANQPRDWIETMQNNPPPVPQSKTVLISGCSSGIGYCVAKNLQQRGYQVFATARQSQDVQRLQQQGLNSLLLDLNDTDSIQECVHSVLAQSNGRIDVLFNNGGYGQPGAVEDLSRDVFRAQLETNLLGTLDLINRVIPVMRQQRFGRIIQNSSVLGTVALPYRGAYVASKFALKGLSDTLRLELHGSGISISVIEPGPIVSNFRKNAFNAFHKNIDQENSVHRDNYIRIERRLTRTGKSSIFTLPPEAVLQKVIHAIESPKPKIRYYVTFPTYLFAVLKRTISDRALDWFLLKISNEENR